MVETAAHSSGGSVSLMLTPMQLYPQDESSLVVGQLVPAVSKPANGGQSRGFRP